MKSIKDSSDMIIFDVPKDGGICIIYAGYKVVKSEESISICNGNNELVADIPLNKFMKPNPYGTGRDDLLIKTPSNGLIRNNILTEEVQEEIVIDSGMKAIIELLWDNNIQTRGCCYGHIEEGKECVAWVDVSVDCFSRACQLAGEYNSINL